MSKKMCRPKTSRTIIEMIGYSYPTYHPTKKSYVDFFYYDPRDGKVKRKKYHVDRIKGKRERARYARDLILQLSVQLNKGWRPWASSSNVDRQYVKLDDCIEKYITRIKNIGRKKTVQSYTTCANILRIYINTLSKPPVYSHELTTEICCEFLDWLIDERSVGARTRNNYRTWLVAFCTWMHKRKYVAENPATGIEKLRENEKIRKSLTKPMLEQLFTHLKEKDPHFLLAVMMEYYTFIRPNELHYIKIKDIEVMKQRIFVSKQYSKNHRDSYVAINKTVILQMIETGLFNSPGEYYVFGKDFKPSKDVAEYNLFNKKWEKVRTELKWGKEYKFYSLKDSGIRDLANSEGIVTARDQARHTDVATTNKYLEGRGDVAPEEAKKFKGYL